MRNCYNCRFYDSYNATCINNMDNDTFDEDEMGADCVQFDKGIYNAKDQYGDDDDYTEDEYDDDEYDEDFEEKYDEY